MPVSLNLSLALYCYYNRPLLLCLQSVMELDWRLFGSAVELQLDLDLDPLILTPAWRGLKLMELLTRHSLYLIRREVGRYIVSTQ